MQLGLDQLRPARLGCSRAGGLLPLVALLAWPSVLCPHTAEGALVVVAIGIDEYDSDGILPVRGAVNDARGIVAALQDSWPGGGFQAKILTSDRPEGDLLRPTEDAIVLALDWAQGAAQQQDTFILFFAGHGVRPQGWQDSFILPVDVPLGSRNLLAAKSLSLDTLRKLISGVKCAHHIIIMDCCRNDPFAADGPTGRGGVGGVASEELTRDIRVMGLAGFHERVTQSSAVLFACGVGQQARWLKDGSNGVFTHYLIRGLQGQAMREDVVTLPDLWDYAEQHVQQYVSREYAGAAQTPWHRDEGTGRIELARRPAEPPPQPTSPDDQPWERPGKGVGDETDGPDGGRYVWVPPGEFEMGSKDGSADERPVHRVLITKGFWLSKHEVMNEQYAAFLSTRSQGNGGSIRQLLALGDSHCEIQKRGRLYVPRPGREHNPVVVVTWHGASEYCKHYGLRLPTEAEWEYAARGEHGTTYPWGDAWDPRKCCCFDNNRGRATAKTFPVGSFLQGASWCGALDMVGNVWEWCNDWYHHAYYEQCPPSDPPGPARTGYRAVRGGCWLDDAVSCRSTNRDKYTPAACTSNRGFRPAVTPPG